MQRGARIVALLLLVATVSCSPGRLTKQEFIREADAICGEFDDQLAAMSPPTSTEGIRPFAQRTRQVVEEALTRLRELQPPEEDAADVDGMLDNLATAADLLPELAEAATAQDLERIQELNGQFSAEINDFNEAATAYGLETCASAPTSGG